MKVGVNALSEQQQQARRAMLVMNAYAKEEGIVPSDLKGSAKTAFEDLSVVAYSGDFEGAKKSFGLQSIAAAESNYAPAIARTSAVMAGLPKIEAIYSRYVM